MPEIFPFQNSSRGMKKASKGGEEKIFKKFFRLLHTNVQLLGGNTGRVRRDFW